jgi:hypothetical protein
MVFPSANTNYPISETWLTRLLARLLVSVGTALIVALLLPEPRPAGAALPAENPTPPTEG